LLAKGRDEEAIDVLYKIAKFNKQPQPQLTIDDFRLLDKEVAERESITSDEPILEGTRPLTTGQLMRKRLAQFVGQFKHLKGLLATKRMIWLSLTLWVAYVRRPGPLRSSSSASHSSVPLTLCPSPSCRWRSSSRSRSQVATCRSSCAPRASTRAPASTRRTESELPLPLALLSLSVPEQHADVSPHNSYVIVYLPGVRYLPPLP